MPNVALGFAFTGAQLGPLDISGTAAAASEVQAFTDRLHRRGIHAPRTAWTVYTLPAVQEALDADPDKDGPSGSEGPLGNALVVPRAPRWSSSARSSNTASFTPRPC